MFLQTNFLPAGLWNNFTTVRVYDILQMQLTKNVNPEKFEFGTTLRLLNRHVGALIQIVLIIFMYDHCVLLYYAI